MRAASAPAGAWARSFQERASRPPSGIESSQAGGGGTWRVGRERAKVMSRSDCSMIVSTASQTGMTMIIRRIRPITATAGPRRPPSRAWSLWNSGQVATTMVTAQMPGPMKGRTTQTLPSRSPVIARIPITFRGRLVTGIAMAFSGRGPARQSSGTGTTGADETKVRRGPGPWGMTGPVRTPGAIEAEVDEVQAWVRRVLPGGGRGLRVLEVGCGPGVLAERLTRDGVQLTAIDVSEEQVAQARARGVPAISSDFLSFEAPPFDVVLFTRSLHHIAPLEAGIAKIRALVRPGGLVVADEFAHDEIDAVTAAWFWDAQAVLERCGALAPDVPRRHHGHGHGGHGEHHGHRR